MKTLKLFRLLSMAAGLTCFMISCLPDGKGEDNSFILYNARKVYESEN